MKALTLVSACSVLSGSLRCAWLMSLRGRGMYCKVKLLRDGRADQRRRVSWKDALTRFPSKYETLISNKGAKKKMAESTRL